MSSKIYKNTGNKGDYKVTFYGWIFRDPDYGPFKNEETLFEHEKVQKLTFERNTLGHNDIEGANPIRDNSNHKVITYGVHVAYFAKVS